MMRTNGSKCFFYIKAKKVEQKQTQMFLAPTNAASIVLVPDSLLKRHICKAAVSLLFREFFPPDGLE